MPATTNGFPRFLFENLQTGEKRFLNLEEFSELLQTADGQDILLGVNLLTLESDFGVRGITKEELAMLTEMRGSAFRSH